MRRKVHLRLYHNKTRLGSNNGITRKENAASQRIFGQGHLRRNQGAGIAAAMNRKSDIEAKRAKLQELRRQKELKEKERNRILSSGINGHPASNTRGKTAVDRLVDDLVGPRAAARGTAQNVDSASETTVPPSESTPPSLPAKTAKTTAETAPPAPEAVKAPQTSQALPATTSVVPRFDKAVETHLKRKKPHKSQLGSAKDILRDITWDSDSDTAAITIELLTKRIRESLQKEKENSEPETPLITPQTEPPTTTPTSAAAAISKNLPVEVRGEFEPLLRDDRFAQFLVDHFKIVETAYRENSELTVDYTGKPGLQVPNSPDAFSRAALLSADPITSGRSVVSIDWSLRHPMRLLVALSKPQHTSSTSVSALPGLLLVWNTELGSEPEFTLWAPCEISAACFSTTDSYRIYGGCHTGQVLCWDVRRSSYPVLSSPVNYSTLGHGGSVLSIQMSASASGYTSQVLTASVDGTICAWDPSVLDKPQELLELRNATPGLISESQGVLQPASRYMERLAPRMISLLPESPMSFLCGCEDGNVYLGNRFAQPGLSAGIDWRVLFRGHRGPVMGLAVCSGGVGAGNGADLTRGVGEDGGSSGQDVEKKPGAAFGTFGTASQTVEVIDARNTAVRLQIGDGHTMFLTCGCDWTIKLWYLPPLTSIVRADGSGPVIVEPILSIGKRDPVYDVKWNPVEPFVFATVDGGGVVDIWDLREGCEIPVATQRVADTALMRAAWSPDGKQLVVGDLQARAHLYVYKRS